NKRVDEVGLAHKTEDNVRALVSQHTAESNDPPHEPIGSCQGRRAVDGRIQGYQLAFDGIRELSFKHHHDDFCAQIAGKVGKHFFGPPAGNVGDDEHNFHVGPSYTFFGFDWIRVTYFPQRTWQFALAVGARTSADE